MKTALVLPLHRPTPPPLPETLVLLPDVLTPVKLDLAWLGGHLLPVDLDDPPASDDDVWPLPPLDWFTPPRYCETALILGGADPPPVVDRVVVTVSLDPYLSLRALVAYSGLGRDTLTKFLHLPPDQALPCYRLPGSSKILVRRSEFDAWIAQYRTRGRPGLVAAIKALGLDIKT